MRLFDNFNQFLKFQWMIFIQKYDFFLKVILGFFRHPAASQLGVDTPFLKGLLLKALLFFRSHAGAPPQQKKRWESKVSTLKHQITDWFVQDLCCPRTLPSRLVLGAFVLWLGVDAVFVVLFGAGSISCSMPPGASGCKLPFIFFWYIIHTYRCIFEMTHLHVNIH